MTSLKLLPQNQYRGVNDLDPIKYYYWPIFGKLYRRRVEMALAECRGGERVLEVGFGTGLAFLNLRGLYQEIHGIDLTADIQAVESVFKPYDIPLFLRKGDVLHMPYQDNTFDTVLLVSILEHLQPDDLRQALREIKRVLRSPDTVSGKPGGQVVYGTPVERPFMVFMFRLLGHDIRKEHFSTEKQTAEAASEIFQKVRIKALRSVIGPIYEVGHFVKA